MKRNTLNFVIDAVSSIVLIGMIGTGLILRFVLPPGSGSRRLLWGFARHDWGDVHYWLAIAIGTVLVVHVALHWQWICVTVSRLIRRQDTASSPPRPLWRNLLGVSFFLFLAGLLSGFVWMANRSVTDHRGTIVADGSIESRGQIGNPDGSDAPNFIRGSMTLSEVAQVRGISVESVRSQLNLPNDVSGEERLGRLSRQYGFSMQQVRDKLNALSVETGDVD